MQTLTLGYSPCPNDTFIFNALIHQLVPCKGIKFEERLEDVETLNRLAMSGVLDLTKISYHAFGHLRERYLLLHSGGALGRGCGPLLIANKPGTMANLRDSTVLIPGELTTANLLLQLHESGIHNTRSIPFEQIIPALSRGEAEAGVIIHESRFTYQQHGLHQILDLGQWWEELTGLPIPLGGILARRDLDPQVTNRIDQALRASVIYAQQHPQAAKSYIHTHAQELSDQVTNDHIQLYVNDFSLDLGDEGVAAVKELLARAQHRGLIPECNLPLFAET
ncbi:MAG: 1,4-dihydroxy-6-naphthoate synthase [Desulfobacteraceae bacterium 4572_35.1]|nr:MAG: 1,4-dihydroxy-6-naphthoate synthase [Desulfobacteraceae bacterium 4572_35.1]